MLLRILFLLLLLPLGLLGKSDNGTAAREALANKKAGLTFIENAGQITDQYGHERTDIDYKTGTPGLSIFIGKGQVHYQFSDSNGRYRMDVTLVGANKGAPIVADDQASYYERYYTLSPDGLVAHAYQKITYQNIYPNIDWVWRIKDNQAEYDFVVRPGGNASNIQMQYEGVTSLSIMNDGRLTAGTPLGSISELKPYSYQENGKSVGSSFELNGQLLAFNVGSYNGTLVIDPKVVWATYYGGIGYEDSKGVALDTGGNVYITGNTTSTTNIATTGSYQSSYGGGTQSGDVFVAKFNPAGSRQWATYYGGSGEDNVYDIACDTMGNVYLTGQTNSTNGIASIGSYHGTRADSYDGFLAKFNNSGARQWGTYIGGSSTDLCTSIACDGSNVFICGYTGSDTGIATSGAFKITKADIFLEKFNAAGQVQWGTYYCHSSSFGSNYNVTSVDPAGNVYLAGITDSTHLATAGSQQPVYGGGTNDIFLAKFNSSGTHQWATYYGGNGSDCVTDLGCDNLGNIYLCGVTTSADSIATPGSYQATRVTSGSNPFIVKLNNNGIRQWATFYTKYIYYMYLSFDKGDNMYFSCVTGIGSGQQTGDLGAFKTNGQFEYDTVFSNFYSPIGGGSLFNVCDQAGSIYITGDVSVSGLATPGAFQTGGNGNGDALLMKLSLDHTVYIVKPYKDSNECAGSSFKLPFGVNYSFLTGNVFTAQLSDNLGSFANPLNIGNNTTVTADSITCTLPTNLMTGNGYRIRIIASNPPDTSSDDGLGIHITGRSTFSTNSPVCVGDTLKLAVLDSVSGIKYSWTEPRHTDTGRLVARPNTTINDSGNYFITATLGNCRMNDTIHVAVKLGPAPPIPGSNNPVCQNGDIHLTANSITGATYQWAGPNNYSSLVQNPVITTVPLYDSGYYKLTITVNGCKSTDSTKVAIKPTPVLAAVTVMSNSPICAGDTLKLHETTSTPGVTYAWIGPNGFTSKTQDTIIAASTTTNSGAYSGLLTLNECTLPFNINVTVRPKPTPLPGSNGPVCQQGDLHLTASGLTGTTYRWTGPNGFSVSVQNPVLSNVPLNDSGYYAVTATLNGCVTKDSIKVVVRSTASPIGVTATGNSPVCAGDTIKLSAGSTTTGVTYSWTGPNGFASGAKDTFIANTTIANSGNYYATITLNGCLVTDTVVAVVNPIPLTTNNNTPMCLGGPMSLMAVSTAGATYNWTGPHGLNNNNQNQYKSSIGYIDTGYYVVMAQLNGCNSNADTLYVSLAPGPANVVATGNGPLCTGDTLRLNVSTTSTGASFSWSGPSGYRSNAQNIKIPNAAASTSGNYIVSVRVTGCTITDTVTVVVSPIPLIAGSNSPVCLNTPLNLTANSSGGATYSWAGPGGYTVTAPNPVKGSMAYSDTGNYIVTAHVTGCNPISDTIHVVTASGPANVTATGNSPVCAGDTMRLVSGSTTTGVSFGWTGPGGYASNLQNANVPNAAVAKSGTYTLTATVNGCVVNKGVIMAVTPLPMVPLVGSNGPICAAQDLDLTAVSGTPGVSYSWSGPGGYTSAAQNPIIHGTTLSNAGIYTASATLNGCSSSSPVTVLIKLLPGSAVAGSNSPVCSGQNLNLTAGSSTAGVTYTWHGPGFTSLLQNPVITGATLGVAGNYTVFLNLNGCVDTLQIPVVVNAATSTPGISISVVPNDTICFGSIATFTASVTNAGTSPTYQWKKFASAVGSNSPVFSSGGILDLDQISCHLTSNAVCQTVNAVNSNTITMHVSNNIAAPIITIAISGNNPKTFTANALGSSANLIYQWEKNSMPIAGATANTYTTNVSHGDTISVVVRSKACMTPDSVKSSVAVGVMALNSNRIEAVIYPNPVTDIVTIEHAKGALARFSSLTGQVLLTKDLTSDVEVINTSELAAGVFVLTLHTDNGGTWSKVLVKTE